MPLTISSGAPPNGTSGVAYNFTFTATGGTPAYTWSISAGALPAGLTLTAGGVLSGTPTTAGSSTFTVQVTDTVPATATASYTVQIAIRVTTATLPYAIVGVPYSGSLSATGGTPPYTWAVTTGSLPAGVTLSSAGVFGGVPSAAGTSNFTVTVTGTAGATGTQALSLAVKTNPQVRILTCAACGFYQKTTNIDIANLIVAQHQAGYGPAHVITVT
jgi:hypothetical protein